MRKTFLKVSKQMKFLLKFRKWPEKAEIKTLCLACDWIKPKIDTLRFLNNKFLNLWVTPLKGELKKHTIVNKNQGSQ